MLTFLKGKKKYKEALKQSEPTLFLYFEEVWGVRNRHMVKNLPHPYVFMLLPCKVADCPHPRCQPDAHSDDGNTCTWYPDGPKLEYFPTPIPDPKRPWGGPCEQCHGKCAGHYLHPEDHLLHYQTYGKMGMKIKPPSVVIAETYKKATKEGCGLSSGEIMSLAKETLLTEEDVKMWLHHLSDVTARRKEGTKRATATRSKNRSEKNSVGCKGKINCELSLFLSFSCSQFLGIIPKFKYLNLY